MQEYYGKNAKNYRQPPDKYVRLFPAIDRIIKNLSLQSKKVLDLGCGDGVLYSMFFESGGFNYTGMDISSDMIAQALVKNPTGNFVVGNGSQFPAEVGKDFDFVISNMLFPSVSNFKTFKGIFTEVARVLKQNGYFIATIMNPCFDGYMQKMLFDREDVETEFKGYYASPTKYVVHREIEGVKFTFEDYHWQLSDYLTVCMASSMHLVYLDECKPVEDATGIGGPFLQKMLRLPNYSILVFQKF